MELVDKYLIPNKELLISKISELDQINFTYESQKRYVDVDGKEKPDKIDIYINKLGLQNVWREQDENVYFSIECKRIKILSDTKHYISDIQKFAHRNHTNLRLPFESMLAFVENKTLGHLEISNEINKRLRKESAILTNEYLNTIELHKKFKSSYLSTHKKLFNEKNCFSIYHILFDYTENVSE
jgi:hypothetical protein